MSSCQLNLSNVKINSKFMLTFCFYTFCCHLFYQKDPITTLVLVIRRVAKLIEHETVRSEIEYRC